MPAFVTGSTGLLGNNLARTLLEAGHEVWALARSKEKARRELGDTAAHIVVGDVRNVAGFAYDLEGIDVVFHTAAYQVIPISLILRMAGDKTGNLEILTRCGVAGHLVAAL